MFPSHSIVMALYEDRQRELEAVANKRPIGQRPFCGRPGLPRVFARLRLGGLRPCHYAAEASLVAR